MWYVLYNVHVNCCVDCSGLANSAFLLLFRYFPVKYCCSWVAQYFISIFCRSRLVRQYKLLYKPWALSMGEDNFRPSTVPRPLDRFSWNLKYIITSWTRPRAQNFWGLCRRGWSGQIASLTHESFCPFFSFLWHAHRSHFWTHPKAQYVVIRRFRQGSAFWGLERLNLKFDLLYAPKT